MPAFIEATGRSYPNPIDGTTYESLGIEFYGEGPGSLPLGKDEVFYIGSQESVCVAGCNGSRQSIYRWYNGRHLDHKYSIDQELDIEDLPGETNDLKNKLRGYNKEPHSGRPIFYFITKPGTGLIPIYIHYSASANNTRLTTSITPDSGYSLVIFAGYIASSAGNATPYLKPGEAARPLYHYRYNKNGKIDDFYTTSAQEEVNLQPHPVPGSPSQVFAGDYVYQGTIGYVFMDPYGLGERRTIADIGQLGPTGQCVDKSGWYQYASQGLYSYFSYRRIQEIPNQINWGEEDIVAITSDEANFEWSYGVNGAVKGAVPRFLGFETAYESQFVYYVYDTTYPWNGPIFGLNYSLNNVPCAPVDENGNVIDVQYVYKSHFYQVRPDSWQTTKSKITLTDIKSRRVNESFWTADTETKRIFFRYTSSTGAFRRGDFLNGWLISEIRYFGDELKCGYISLTEINPATGNGQVFSANQTITSADGATAIVMAGYGIKNKAAFFGVYEFPKKLSYYKVFLDEKALIPHRNLDEAEAEAIIENGKVVGINIINAGTGYKSPKITISTPEGLEPYSPQDAANQVARSITNDGDFIAKKESDNLSDLGLQSIQIAAYSYGNQGAQDTASDGNRIMQTAAAEVANLSPEGRILSINVTNPGSGYRADNPPKVFIVDPEYDTRKDNYQGTDVDKLSGQFDDFMGGMDKFKNLYVASPQEAVTNAINTMFEGTSLDYPTSYIKVAEIDPDSKTRICQTINSSCASIEFPGIANLDNYLDEEFMQRFTSASKETSDMVSQRFPSIFEASANADIIGSRYNGVYGFQGGQRCADIDQPKLYNATRFVDLPCPTRELDPETNKVTAVGWMVHKYCASQASDASFKVSLHIEGHTIGPQGQNFMSFLKNLPAAKLTPKRAAGGYRTWHCTRNGINGRCYRNPVDQDDIIFIPIGLDENTFDYDQDNYSEYQQFQMWLRGNLSQFAYGTRVTNSTAVDPNTGQPLPGQSYNVTQIQVQQCNGSGIPPNECWDSYVRSASNPNGVLDVYCGWDANGDPIAGQTYCQVPELIGGYGYFGFSCWALDTVNSVAIAVQPKRITDELIMPLGSYDGDFIVKNWASGATYAFARSINNFGNPYFDECE